MSIEEWFTEIEPAEQVRILALAELLRKESAAIQELPLLPVTPCASAKREEEVVKSLAAAIGKYFNSGVR